MLLRMSALTGFGADHRYRLAGERLLRAVGERDLRLALAHGERGRLPVRRDIDRDRGPGASA